MTRHEKDNDNDKIVQIMTVPLQKQKAAVVWLFATKHVMEEIDVAD